MRFSTLVALLLVLVAPACAHAAGDWSWPVVGEVITDYRNGADPYAAGQHRGIDIAAELGTPVVAATGGTVTFAGVAGSSGMTVAIATADGRFDTSYLHLSEIDVRRGDTVAAGARLGAVGMTGRRSQDRAHLHFGVRDAGNAQAYRDPVEFLAVPLGPVVAPRAPLSAPERTPPLPPSSLSVRPLPGEAPSPRGLPAGRQRARIGAARGAPGLRPVVGRGTVLHGGQGSPAPGATGRERPSARLPAGPPMRKRQIDAVADGRDARSRRQAQLGPAGLALGSAPSANPQTHGAAGPPRARRAARPERDDRIDLGWLAACIGVVLAAVALGHPSDVSRLARRGRAALATVTRPAPGGG